MGGTEAFPSLGKHCEEEDCHQLDFLPFRCDGCQKVFCLEHRSYKDHRCPKADHKSRLVIVCEACSTSMEKKGDEDEEEILKRHASSGKCDPTKKQKLKCPVKRCRAVLTFSNTSTCKACNQKVCLKHRFPSEHPCSPSSSKGAISGRHLLVPSLVRNGTQCRDKNGKVLPAVVVPPVKAF